MHNYAQGFERGSGDTSAGPERIYCSGDSDPVLAQPRQNQLQLSEEELESQQHGEGRERQLSDEELEWQLADQWLERKLSEG